MVIPEMVSSPAASVVIMVAFFNPNSLAAASPAAAPRSFGLFGHLVGVVGGGATVCLVGRSFPRRRAIVPVRVNPGVSVWSAAGLRSVWSGGGGVFARLSQCFSGL